MAPIENEYSKMSPFHQSCLVDGRLADSIVLVVVVAGLKAKLSKFTFSASEGLVSDYVI